MVLQCLLFILEVSDLNLYLLIMGVHKCLDDDGQNEVQQKELAHNDDHDTVDPGKYRQVYITQDEELVAPCLTRDHLEDCEEGGTKVIIVGDPIVQVLSSLNVLFLKGKEVIVLNVPAVGASGTLEIAGAIKRARPLYGWVIFPHLAVRIREGGETAGVVDHACVLLDAHSCEEDEHEDHEDPHIREVRERVHQGYEQLLHLREDVNHLQGAEDNADHSQGGRRIRGNEKLCYPILNIDR